MNPHLRIRVIVELEGQYKVEANFMADEYVTAKYLSPLYGIRDLPWAVQEAETARNKKAIRDDILRDFGRQLADNIIKQIDGRDPINGYSPEEWEMLNRP